MRLWYKLWTWIYIYIYDITLIDNISLKYMILIGSIFFKNKKKKKVPFRTINETLYHSFINTITHNKKRRRKIEKKKNSKF